MPIIYIAYRQEPNEKPQKIVDSSRTRLLKDLRAHMPSSWTIATYKVKTDVGTLMAIMKNMKKFPIASVEGIAVSDKGRSASIDVPAEFLADYKVGAKAKSK